jgi:phosphoserine/homoserine phosphotransferase
VEIACLDLEGVLVPEIWIAFAEKPGSNPSGPPPGHSRLRRVDEAAPADSRRARPEARGYPGSDRHLKPLDGAIEFVNWLRERFQVVILSDTFYEFSQPDASTGLPDLAVPSFDHR